MTRTLVVSLNALVYKNYRLGSYKNMGIAMSRNSHILSKPKLERLF